VRNFSAAWERRSELSGGARLAGGWFCIFWTETEWMFGGGRKSATDCGERIESVVVMASVFGLAESTFRRRSSSAFAA